MPQFTGLRHAVTRYRRLCCQRTKHMTKLDNVALNASTCRRYLCSCDRLSIWIVISCLQRFLLVPKLIRTVFMAIRTFPTGLSFHRLLLIRLSFLSAAKNIKAAFLALVRLTTSPTAFLTLSYLRVHQAQRIERLFSKVHMPILVMFLT